MLAPMGGGGSRGTLEAQKHLLLAAKETEAGEVIKLPRVRQPASHLSSQTEIQVSGLLSSSPVEKSPLWKQPVRPPKRSSSFAGMMVILLCSRWSGCPFRTLLFLLLLQEDKLECRHH